MQKKIGSIFLFLVCFLAIPTFLGLSDDTPPFYDQIMKIMQPLEYSGVPVMVKPSVTLSVDFNKRIWTLHNIHDYDSHGGIILVDNRYGLCAELATYLYEQIRPLLNDHYEVKFAQVTEAGYFSDNQSNHIVLILADKLNNQAYIIDPSFHQYAKVHELPDYHILNVQDTLGFVRDQSHDVFFSVDQAIPLYIKKDYLLTFAVTSVDGKFDKDNLIFVISANQRYKFSGRDIVLIGWRNHEFEDYENKAMLEQLLTPDEIKVLFDKIKSWIAKRLDGG